MHVLLRVDDFSSPQDQNMTMNGARVKPMVHAFRWFLNRVDTLLRTRDMAF